MMKPVLREEEIDDMDSDNELDHDLIPSQMLEDVCYGTQSRPNVIKREACYKIGDSIR